MFTITKDEKLISFAEINDKASFGDGERVLFWVDLQIGMLQRGRMEMIPLTSIDSFDIEGANLIANLGHHKMTLFTATDDDLKKLPDAVDILNKTLN